MVWCAALVGCQTKATPSSSYELQWLDFMKGHKLSNQRKGTQKANAAILHFIRVGNAILFKPKTYLSISFQMLKW